MNEVKWHYHDINTHESDIVCKFEPLKWPVVQRTHGQGFCMYRSEEAPQKIVPPAKTRFSVSCNTVAVGLRKKELVVDLI